MKNKNNLTTLILNRRYGNRNSIYNSGAQLLPPKPINNENKGLPSFTLHSNSTFVPNSILKSTNVGSFIGKRNKGMFSKQIFF